MTVPIGGVYRWRIGLTHRAGPWKMPCVRPAQTASMAIFAGKGAAVPRINATASADNRQSAEQPPRARPLSSHCWSRGLLPSSCWHSSPGDKSAQVSLEWLFALARSKVGNLWQARKCSNGPADQSMHHPDRQPDRPTGASRRMNIAGSRYYSYSDCRRARGLRFPQRLFVRDIVARGPAAEHARSVGTRSCPMRVRIAGNFNVQPRQRVIAGGL